MLNSGHKQCITLNGIVSLIKVFLNKDFNYILPGNFQSDKLPGEFGIFCQSAEIMNSLSMQRFKLFIKLDIEKVVSHSKEEC